MNKPTIVMVGAGQTAAVAARTLRRRGYEGRVVLIGDEPHMPYQRPPLSKEFLSGDDDFADLAILPEKWLATNDIDIQTGRTVTRVDAATGTVETADGHSLRADAVLLATGGRPRTLPVPGPRPDLVHHLRTIDDARRLRRTLAPGLRLGLIGAGFVGLEIAAAAVSSGAAVTVLEAGTAPLAAVFGQGIGEVCARMHRDRGVDIRTNACVTALRTTDDAVVVEVRDGTPLQFDAVLIGIGMTPSVEVAVASGLTVDGGIVTDAQGRTSMPNVYAAGDVARRFSQRAGRHVRHEHFDNANKQGAAVANVMMGRDVTSDEAMWCWSDQYEHNLQFLGEATGSIVVRGNADALDFTAFYLADGALVGAFTVDRGEDIMVARELLGRSVDVGLLADPDAELWDLTETEEVAS